MQYDTAYGLLVCADTARSQPDWHGTELFYIYGYEVTLHDMTGPVHVAWLDTQMNHPRYIMKMYEYFGKR